ncbi:MAG: ABC transporter permease [Cyclobacteriaceae bacterium]|nr:ABC transporter permease [Cyclobacteriaceae bacterium]
MTFTASLRSEFLKIKRTSVIYLILIAAFVVPFVLVFDHDIPAPNNPANGGDHFYSNGFKVFAFLFIPFFFILASTLLMQIEVRNHAWKQVLASPQSFLHILLAKFAVIQVLALVFLIVFNAYMVMGCALIDVIYGVDFLAYLDRWPELLKLNLMALGSTVGISVLSFWLALRYKNFIAPIAIGFLLWLIGPTAALELKWPHFDKYVFVLPFTIMVERFEDKRMFYQLLSMGYGVVFFGIAYFEFVLQRMPLRALWRKKIKDISGDHQSSSRVI